jgi:hypothetical protein
MDDEGRRDHSAVAFVAQPRRTPWVIRRPALFVTPRRRFREPAPDVNPAAARRRPDLNLALVIDARAR